MEFLIMVEIFSIFLLKVEIYNQSRLQKISINHFFLIVIYFWNKLPNQIKNSNSIKNLRLNSMISKIMVKKEFKRAFLGTIG